MNNWSTANKHNEYSIYQSTIVSGKANETSATRALELEQGWQHNPNIYLLSYKPKKVETNYDDINNQLTNIKMTNEEAQRRLAQLQRERDAIFYG